MGTGEYKSTGNNRREHIKVPDGMTPPARSPRRLPDSDAPRVGSTTPDLWYDDEFQTAIKAAVADAVKATMKAKEDSGPNKKSRRWTRETTTPKLVTKKKDSYEMAVLIIKWAAAAVVSVFTAGVIYSQTIQSNATKADLVPVNDRLRLLEEKVQGLERSVSGLAAHDEERRSLEYKVRRLNTYRSEYQEALSEYAAAKAMGKTASRPRKTTAHLDLEAELEGL